MSIGFPSCIPSCFRTFAAALALSTAAGIPADAVAQGAGAGPVAGAAGRPIRVVVPFAAGSYTDNVGRIVMPVVAERLGVPVIIDNRPGGNGVIGADAVAKSAPDGLTFLMGGASVNAVNPWIYKSLPYDPARDLVGVVGLGELPFMLLVNPAVPASTVPELVAHAKANPGKLAYGTPNSVTLVGMETLKRMAGVDILGVPYKSSPQAMGDLVGNQIQVIIADFATAMPHVRGGKAKLLAVTMSRRSTLLPDVPTVGETFRGYEIAAFNGIFTARGAPREAIVRFADAAQAALAVPSVRERLTGIGFDIGPQGPDTFGDYARSQMAMWGRLIREAGVPQE
jgi:tripartite-type tricarboxylate transporter receptor subunit TctC